MTKPLPPGLLRRLLPRRLPKIRVPAYGVLDPDTNGAKVSKEGISGWTDPQITVSWFGEIKTAGAVDASVIVRLPPGTDSRWRLTGAGQNRGLGCRQKRAGHGQVGTFNLTKPGYVRSN